VRMFSSYIPFSPLRTVPDMVNTTQRKCSRCLFKTFAL
jgi:hypothetical protein